MIKVVSWRVNFLIYAIADFEGLLAVNREIYKQQMSEKAPPDAPPYCAVFPKIKMHEICKLALTFRGFPAIIISVESGAPR